MHIAEQSEIKLICVVPSWMALAAGSRRNGLGVLRCQLLALITVLVVPSADSHYRSAAHSLEVPLYFQFEGFVTHICGPVIDSPSFL